MSMSIDVMVVSNRFPEIAGKLQRHVTETVQWAVTQEVAVAQPITPVDTGALRSNTSTSVSGDSGTVTWNQYYAAFVHEGTYKMAARPFARQALDIVGPQFVARLAMMGL